MKIISIIIGALMINRSMTFDNRLIAYIFLIVYYCLASLLILIPLYLEFYK